MTAPPMEYLGATRAPGAGRRPWIAMAVGVLVVLLAAAAWWANGHIARAAESRLAGLRLAAQQEAVAGEARVLSTLQYASPMIWSASVPEGVRAGLRRLVEADALRVSAALAGLDAEAEATLVLPWQEEQKGERDLVRQAIAEARVPFQRIGIDAREIATAFVATAASVGGASVAEDALSR